MRLAIAVLGILLLSGCAAATPSQQPSRTASPAPSHPAGWVFCDSFVPGMSDYADYILEVSKGQYNRVDHQTEGAYIAAMRRYAPSGETTLVEDYASPWDAVDAVVKAGGGHLSLNTNRFKSSIVPLMAFCNGVGYKISQ